MFKFPENLTGIAINHLKEIVQPKQKDDDLRRKEKVLYIVIVVSNILLSFLISAKVYYKITEQDEIKNSIGTPILFLILIVFSILFILAKRGFVRTSIILFISIYLFATAYSTYKWGFSFPSELLLYSLIITFSSAWLLSSEDKNRENKILRIDKMADMNRMSEFGKIANGLFHDLIGPLSSVNLYVNEIKSENEKTAEAKDYINKAMRASARIQQMINALRKNMNSSDEKIKFCINDEIIQSIELFSHRLNSGNISLIFDNDIRINILGNPLRFNQVISNILSNAIDSFDNCIRDNKYISIYLKEKYRYVSISIRDNGCGIEKDNLKKIFEPFYTTKEKDKGSGIGLTTVKEIVEKEFGGKIYVKSKPKKGAMFMINLSKKRLVFLNP